ncbi:FtsH protease activity modulator HflK [Pseudoluteimonas lycopersici]|uniref:Protein HflK n=1 Tax=Pseudoluteimonas lycopersici TaxID=1324796 RepID=A0A516V1W1_9GAMM|nr:FtsH protease activity modulator HflK [Lysobacter lycopersici]
MAWNTPGGNDGGKRGDDWLSRLSGPFRGIAGDGGYLRWIAIAVVVMLALDSFVLVTEQQRGVVLRFGQFARVMQPGPHLKMPWPVERVIKVEATQIQTFSDNVPVLTSDENIVKVEINVQYRVRDPQLYLFGTRDAREVLAQAALSTVREQVGRSNLDTVLGAREALAVSARQRLQKSLDAYRTGLVVTELNLPNARPPEEVKPAFDDVNSAQQDRDRLVSEAQAYAARVVPEARGKAARVRTVAEGYKTAAIATATGDAQRFDLLVAQYKAAPEVTRKRLWLETVQDVLSRNRTVVGGDGRQLIYVPMSAPTQAPAATTPPYLPDVLSPAVTATTVADDVRPGRQPRSDDREVNR